MKQNRGNIMKNTDQLIILYLYLSFLLFAFFASETSYMVQNIIVPYVKYSPIYIHLALTICVVFLILYQTVNRKISIDPIAMLLFARLGISIIPAIYIEAASNTLGRVTVPLITLLAYFIGRQYKGNIRSIINANAIFVLILAIQTFYTVKHMVVPNIIYYEQYVKIPLASSNVIAAFITPCIFLIFIGYMRNSIMKYIMVCTLFSAVIVSTSKGAFLVLAATAFIYFVFLNNKIDIRIKIISAVFLLMSAIVLYALLNKSLSDFTHQRSDLILDDIKLWTDHIFIGNGMVYEGRGAGSHNIVIDLLVQNGLIGLISYVVPLVIVFKQLFKNRIKSSLCIGLFLVAALLYSLIETSYFSYSNDMIFWFMAGVAISLSQSENQKLENISEKQIVDNYCTAEISCGKNN